MSAIIHLYDVRCRTATSFLAVAPGGYHVQRAQADEVIAELLKDHLNVHIALYRYGMIVITDQGERFFFLEQFLPNVPQERYRLLAGKQFWCCCDSLCCHKCG